MKQERRLRAPFFIVPGVGGCTGAAQGVAIASITASC
jgi:hypothetical protein